jgi:peptidoglycan/LPS O-acetylase OafA/YrhL
VIGHADRLEYQPALDGIRALAVALVLVFHADLGVVGGGYVGVSVFFTLSGFLITRLLLVENTRTGTVDVAEFFARRLRRLLPASLACLAAVVVAARLGAFADDLDLRRDVIGAAFQVQNWVLLSGGDSYRELLQGGIERASPLEHYWSLAIEEQFYWLWPLAVTGLALARKRHRLWVLTAGAAIAAPAIAHWWGPDAAYFATPARLAEILLGACAATWLHQRQLDQRPHPFSRRAGTWIAGGATTVIAAVALTAPADGGPLHHGAFPAFAVVSAALIVALSAPNGATRVYGMASFARIGRVSYGLYLFHWPVYVAVTSQRIGLDGIALFAARVAITVALATVSYRFLERPIRLRHFTLWRTLPTSIVVSGGVVVAALLVVPVANVYWQQDTAIVVPQIVDRTPGAPDDVPAADDAIPVEVVGADPVFGASVSPAILDVGVTPVVLDDGDPLRVLLVGDSTAISLWPGFQRWEGNDSSVSVAVIATPGLSFVRRPLGDPGGGRDFLDWSAAILDDTLPDALDRFRPHVTVVMLGRLDLEDRVWSPDEELLDATSGLARQRVVESYRAVLDPIVANGSRVLLVRSPPMYSYWSDDRADEPHRDTPHRDAYETVQQRLADGHPDIGIIEFRAWLDTFELVLDRDARPDGMHWTAVAADRIVDEWMRHEILRLTGLAPE